uniref:Uncharacterized protein n=1 Tax=Rangifer tarandus platyrhynchus TaxID=3082113 RepID=A0ACB0EWU1_RANTA|nr:unnamed protein product [Rangifer tarandus platyrhynchus]
MGALVGVPPPPDFRVILSSVHKGLSVRPGRSAAQSCTSARPPRREPSLGCEEGGGPPPRLWLLPPGCEDWGSPSSHHGKARQGGSFVLPSSFMEPESQEPLAPQASAPSQPSCCTRSDVGDAAFLSGRTRQCLDALRIGTDGVGGSVPRPAPNVHVGMLSGRPMTLRMATDPGRQASGLWAEGRRDGACLQEHARRPPGRMALKDGRCAGPRVPSEAGGAGLTDPLRLRWSPDSRDSSRCCRGLSGLRWRPEP